MNAQLNQYQSTQVSTSSPEQVLMMLYDGAIRFISQALLYMKAGEKTAKAENISKAIAIVSELSNTLDFEVGGDIADQLDSLYNFMIQELISANLQNDQKRLKVVEGLLVDLRQTWKKAFEEIHKQAEAQSEADSEEIAEPATSSKPGDYQPLNTSL